MKFTIGIENGSAIDFDVAIQSAPAWMQVSAMRLPRSGTALLKGRLAKDAPAGPRTISIGVQVRNLHVRPDAALTTRLAVDAIIAR